MMSYDSPMYLQLQEIVREKIAEGGYPAGAAIPSENELARMYGVNRQTVRNAVDCLVREGLLKRVRGKGAYVLYPRDGCLQQNLDNLSGFTQTMHKSRMTAKVLKKAIRLADEKYSSMFSIRPDDRIHYIKRVCFTNGEPFALEEIYIPLAVVQSLKQIDLSVFTQYDVYDSLGIKITRAAQTLDIVQLDLQEANLLNISDKPSVFLLTTTSYDQYDRPLEHVQSYTRGDKCTFDVHYTVRGLR